MTNPWWLRGVLHNAVSTSGSSAPYTHTFNAGKVPYSMRLVQGTESTDNERILKGAVVASAEISASVGGLGNISLDGAYADETLNTSGVGASQPTVNERPLHFAHANVKLDGSSLSLVQSASLSIENNTDLISELGVRTAVDYSPKQRTADLSFGDIVEDKDELQQMYGSSSATSPQSQVETDNMTFVFDNGKTSSDKNLLKFSLNNIFPEGYGRSGMGDPEADLEGSISRMSPTITATAENSASSAR
jgi:hypothetical protein